MISGHGGAIRQFDDESTGMAKGTMTQLTKQWRSWGGASGAVAPGIERKGASNSTINSSNFFSIKNQEMYKKNERMKMKNTISLTCQSSMN